MKIASGRLSPTLFSSLFANVTFIVGLSLCAITGRAADDAIDSLLWDATASNGDSRAQQAVDGDAVTRWDTGTGQQVGQWFRVDMGEMRSLSRLEIDTSGSSGDYARRYELSVSTDGKKWETAATGDGAVVTKITLPSARVCRYFRISIPAGSPVSGGFWSIHELRAFGDLAAGARAMPRPPIRWHTITPMFPTRDIVVAAYEITDFGIGPNQNVDATPAIKLATRLLARAGGGTLWLPSGRYRITEPLSLEKNVTIRGDWAPPEPGKPIRGTVLAMTANRGNADGPPGISLNSAAAVVGVNFWYPDQRADNIVPYPATIKQFGGTGMCLENVTFINAYRGFVCGPEGAALFFMRNIYGTVLERGIEIDGTSDIGRMEHIRFSPRYWSDSGAPNAPAADGPHVGWMLDNGAGIIMRRNDWSYAYDVELEGYKIGFYAALSHEYESVQKGWKTYPNGNNARFRFIGCRTAIQCENLSGVGMMFHDSDIIGAEVGVLGEEGFDSVFQLQHSRISASKAAVRLLGKGEMLLTECTLSGPIENKTGYIGIAGGTPVAPRKGSAPGVGEIHVVPGLPAGPGMVSRYTTPTDRFAPPSERLAVVTHPAFGAKGDATTDDTVAVQRAIAALGKEGGTVYFPAGEYRITQNLVVPTGVELRGVNEGPHHSQTRGSVIDVIPGRGDENGTPFITLSAQSGLRGLTFHYPEQDALAITAYPWLVRGAGEGVWLINVTTTFAYRILDLATVRCDNHYVDYVAGQALREAFRIGGGSTGGRLLNCQLNPHYYSFTNSYANSPSRLDPSNAGRYMDGNHYYAKEHSDAFVIGDCTDEILFQNFVFGARHGIVLTGTTTGPSGWCLGQGSDQCRWDLWVERIGPGGFPLINTQLVTVDEFKGDHGYIALAPTFTGTVSLIGLDAWGGPSPAIQINGGRLAISSAVIVRSGASTLSLKNNGRAWMTNAVLRNPDLVVERDQPGNMVQLSGVFITGSSPIIADSVADLAEAGLDSVRVLGSEVGVAFDPAKALPMKGWKLRPSVNENEASRAIDGNPSTRWTTARSAHRGDEVVLEMDRAHLISKIRVDTRGSANDYARRFKLYLSTDGTSWGDPVVSGRGESDLRIGFRPQTAKFIRFVNLGEPGGFWSIHEIQVGGQ
ncbi:MAG TPA: discoidin domain-containing protein [Rariglobus sp.]|jgi:hypothetical protein|nr:discoidin domain-containing protein [Rariglobus sp.]